jgi:hypothetical protein
LRVAAIKLQRPAKRFSSSKASAEGLSMSMTVMLLASHSA